MDVRQLVDTGNEEGKMSEKIGFIGLGIMGQGMANNLLKAGFEVNVWNRTPGRMDPFCAAGRALLLQPRRRGGAQRHHHHLRQRHGRC